MPTSYRRLIFVVLVAVCASACGGGDEGGDVADDKPIAEPVPVPVDGVGVFRGTLAYRYAPDSGFAGGGFVISDGAGMAIGGYTTATSGTIIDYRFVRTGDSSSGSLYMRRNQSTTWCAGSSAATHTDNVALNLSNWILSNAATGLECRGGFSGDYQPAMSEFPARSIADLAGEYSSADAPGSGSGIGGGFDVNGGRFTVRIGADGSFRLTNSASCISNGVITLVDVGKGIARVSGMLPACASSATALDGLVAFDGGSLFVALVQPGTHFFYFGTLQEQ
jgi:hypothetical protein